MDYLLVCAMLLVTIHKVLNVFFSIQYLSALPIYIIYIYTKILEVNLYAFVYRLFHEDFLSNHRDFLHASYVSGGVRSEQKVPKSPDDWREIFMKQSVDKCILINF